MAIMRAVPVKMQKNYRKAQGAQEKQLEDAQEEADKKFEERLKKGNRKDLLVRINTGAQEVEASLQQAYKEWYSNPNLFGKMNFNDYAVKRSRPVMQQAVAGPIRQQVARLDKYIEMLSKSTRFKNVKGYLYDPENGWNPGYRVVASDLRSIIPMTPFEELHKKADIFFGQPAGPDSNSMGYVPFTWIQDGARVCVHPILYELARARAIRDIYSNAIKEMVSDRTFWSGSFQGTEILKKFNTQWLYWNKALVKHQKNDFGSGVNSNIKPDDVLLKDYFVRFLQKYRDGKINLNQNNLEFAKAQWNDHLGVEGDTWEAVADGAAAPGKWVAKQASDTIDTVKRVLSYDRFEDKEEEVWEDQQVQEEQDVTVQEEHKEKKWWNPFNWSWVTWIVNVVKRMLVWVWKKVKKVITKAMRAKAAAERLNKWRDVSVNGMSYGTVRDFMIDKGVIHMFNRGIIQNTVGTAEPLIEFLVDKNILPKAPKAKDATPIHDLMWGFFNWAGIKGYSWD